jgi:hypothetical protein
MELKSEKRGFFFSTDAIIAIGLIFLVILISYPIVKEKKYQTDIQYDVITALSSLKAIDANDAYTQSLIAQGLITNTNESMLEAIGQFYVTNKTIAQNLANSLLSELDVPDNIGLWYGSTLLASKNVTPYEQATSIETTTQRISGIQEGQSVTGFSAKAYLSSKVQKRYFYFGGYVGDGNVSLQLQYNGTIQSATLEAATSSNFDAYINQNYSGSYTKSNSTTTPATYILPLNSFRNGTNTIELRANNLSIAGGFLKITYLADAQYEQPTRYYFPGVKGTVNVYDGFYVPGKLNSLSLSLHYNANTNIFLTIGNKTVLNGSSAGETTTSLTNSQLSSLLTYTELENKTTPIRIGLQNLSILGSGLSNVDVVLITDVSGSMDWRLDSDTTGTTRNNCSDPLLQSPSTKRLSLAKCIDKDFISTILNASSDSRVAIVSFSNDANSYVNLTRNQTLLTATVDSYSASGATCVSCSINRAYSILQTSSNSSRIKFIVTMTDGVTNRRSTPMCNDVLASGSSNITTIVTGGINSTLKKSNVWNEITNPNGSTINGIDLFNATLGYAVGENGAIIKWNGTNWATSSSPQSTALYNVNIFNKTFGLAVGASGKVIKWNGTSWSSLATISNNPTLNAVSIWNNTLIFAAGVRSNSGRIYKSTDGGASWSEDYSAGSNFRGVKIINSTLAFAVGDSGRIAKWVPNSWSAPSSPTSENLYAINAYNRTLIVAVGGDSAKSIIINSSGGSWSLSLNVAADSLRDIEIFNNQTIAVGEGATIYEKTTSTWARSFNIPLAYKGNLTAGISCTSDEESCTELNSFPALNANYSSCRTRTDLNATIYSVGFGPIDSCAFANYTLQAIAQCGNGTFYSSSNATQLQKFYSEIANNILKVSFNEQSASIQGNISTTLYPDSYIEFNYTKIQSPYGLAITTEKPFNSDASASFSIPLNATIVEARVLSYSGPRWTTQILANNFSVYNLSTYGSNYLSLGDPYIIQIPLTMIAASNYISLKTGLSPQNTTVGSLSNKVVYTVIKNASGYSPIVATAQGCNWTIQFESGANITATIPTNYTGTDQCFYTETKVQYNVNDAAQTAVYSLLQSIDLNANNKIDVELSSQDIDISLTQLTGIPYTWSTEIQVRTWR